MKRKEKRREGKRRKARTEDVMSSCLELGEMVLIAGTLSTIPAILGLTCSSFTSASSSLFCPRRKIQHQHVNITLALERFDDFMA